MVSIMSVNEFQLLAQDKRNAGKTFNVFKSVFDQLSAPLRAKVKTIGEDEEKSIKCLLGADLNLEGAGLTRDCQCSHCNHKFSLADHIAAAILSGAHSPDKLVKIINGPEYWLTIDTDQPRLVICPKCYRSFATIHCCYTFSSYAYV
jgi:hypothetical protein